MKTNSASKYIKILSLQMTAVQNRMNNLSHGLVEELGTDQVYDLIQDYEKASADYDKLQNEIDTLVKMENRLGLGDLK